MFRETRRCSQHVQVVCVEPFKPLGLDRARSRGQHWTGGAEKAARRLKMSTPMAPITAGGQAFCDVIAEVTCARSQRGHTNMAPTRAHARMHGHTNAVGEWSKERD